MHQNHGVSRFIGPPVNIFTKVVWFVAIQSAGILVVDEMWRCWCPPHGARRGCLVSKKPGFTHPSSLGRFLPAPEVGYDPYGGFWSCASSNCLF